MSIFFLKTKITMIIPEISSSGNVQNGKAISEKLNGTNKAILVGFSSKASNAIWDNRDTAIMDANLILKPLLLNNLPIRRADKNTKMSECAILP